MKLFQSFPLRSGFFKHPAVFRGSIDRLTVVTLHNIILRYVTYCESKTQLKAKNIFEEDESSKLGKIEMNRKVMPKNKQIAG